MRLRFAILDRLDVFAQALRTNPELRRLGVFENHALELVRAVGASEVVNRHC